MRIQGFEDPQILRFSNSQIYGTLSPHRTPMHDIAIIGCGPGGLYAAGQLAQRGFDVAVFEEHPSAGEPVHCTGVLAVEAFDEFDLPRECILNPLSTARFFGPSGGSFEYTTPRTEAVVIDRSL